MANLRGADGEAAKAALQEGRPEEIWSGSELALLQYARALTVACGDREGLAALFQTARAAGVGDGELLEINQVVAYCNYANRTLNGTPDPLRRCSVPRRHMDPAADSVDEPDACFCAQGSGCRSRGIRSASVRPNAAAACIIDCEELPPLTATRVPWGGA